MDIPRLSAILPCTSVPASRAFYARLDFQPHAGDEGYLMLRNPEGAELHLQPTVPGWLSPGGNPFGLYLYTPRVDELAARFPTEILGPTKHPKPNPGACASSPSPTLTAPSSASAGTSTHQTSHSDQDAPLVEDPRSLHRRQPTAPPLPPPTHSHAACSPAHRATPAPASCPAPDSPSPPSAPAE